ncbi:drug/metabolite transporter (DMT)-like permease [Novosphingobium chloroacetimidivorans]|uniref:Drug/metabolite transporter (DMT)-like permease n=1 Tax=Novosphingobium chloroacetimidivorans TaxID=1428314 RepID=A0A7W7KAM5_9SPHN|nr:EamA family transporter [Novosphingobium chloroacetimidivorans]MBB4859065.1 drug/metabolite transporter (DMT)-like permease [Novosphingobium chloroacetimidivorans]
MISPYLWVPFTLLAATAQVLRNALQSGLVKEIGTLGATQVRFVYGLPFAVLLLLAYLKVSGEALPVATGGAVGWMLLGAASQIGATALMLEVMARRDFGVAYACIKTEPVTVALLGLVLIGDRLSPLGWFAVVVVTVGVVLASLRPGDGTQRLGEARPVLIGVASGALFGLSAIAFRAGIDGVPTGSFLVRSLVMLVVSLAMQSGMLLAWFAFRGAAPLAASLRHWRTSLGAGALGALASAGWFIAFSLTIAANVRTLGLIEMPIVALIARRVSGKWLSPREAGGFALITLGVALLLLAHGT